MTGRYAGGRTDCRGVEAAEKVERPDRRRPNVQLEEEE